jgi:hypothetical protein
LRRRDGWNGHGWQVGMRIAATFAQLRLPIQLKAAELRWSLRAQAKQSMSCNGGEWIASSLRSLAQRFAAGNDVKMQVGFPAARYARVYPGTVSPQTEGAGKAGRSAHPQPRVRK